MACSPSNPRKFSGGWVAWWSSSLELTEYSSGSLSSPKRTHRMDMTHMMAFPHTDTRGMHTERMTAF
jgi:hypothetical protein